MRTGSFLVNDYLMEYCFDPGIDVLNGPRYLDDSIDDLYSIINGTCQWNKLTNLDASYETRKSIILMIWTVPGDESLQKEHLREANIADEKLELLYY